MLDVASGYASTHVVAPGRVQITAAQPSHAFGLLALVAEAMGQEGGTGSKPASDHDPFAVSVEEIQALIGAPRSRILVAIQDNQIAGSVLVTRQPNGRCALGLLGVDPAHRRRGLGARLIHSAEQAATSEFGSDQIELCVLAERQKLASYYERLGFTPTGEYRTVPLADATMKFLVMSKRLIQASAA